eukprot:CAMPEP_0117550986 /NCGR_PEP_ID=MMETSP0784-20121206/48959_1 /TAXON_ID=39447 /ORGANISM="" /LENGTH=327 /DNA_ID=CAMNT_0005348013 /DNA_START=56 /DNA_END=1039 /DNA_ORIENTATION=+
MGVLKEMVKHQWAAKMWGSKAAQMQCFVHGKKRSASSLEPDGNGGFCCKADSQCQKGKWDEDKEDRQRAICSVHGKVRSADVMGSDGAGGLQCQPGSECQEGSGSRWGVESQAQGQCFVHGKKRSLRNLTEDGSGGLCCSADAPCQMGKWDEGKERTRGICSTHSKIRSMDVLVADDAGGYCCSPETPCKEGGSSWGGGGNAAKVTQRVASSKGGSWGKGGFPAKGKGSSGKGGAAPKKSAKAGATLGRTRVGSSKVVGRVLEWKGKYGWIQLANPAKHEAASKNDGKVYVNTKDVEDGGALEEGAAVRFFLYADASGLGAEKCSIA